MEAPLTNREMFVEAPWDEGGAESPFRGGVHGGAEVEREVCTAWLSGRKEAPDFVQNRGYQQRRLVVHREVHGRKKRVSVLLPASATDQLQSAAAYERLSVSITY